MMRLVLGWCLLMSCLEGLAAVDWRAAGGLKRLLYPSDDREGLSAVGIPAAAVAAKRSSSGDTLDPDEADESLSTTSEEEPGVAEPHRTRPTDYPEEYEESVRGVRSFIERLERFRSSLYEDGADLHQKLMAAINGGAQSPPSTSKLAVRDFRAQRRIAWWPVTCKLKGVHFKREAKLKDGGPLKNTVYRVRDTTTGRRYAYKLFGKPDDYTSELTFFMVMAGHPNVVRPVCTQREEYESPPRPGLLLELVEGEDSLQAAPKAALSTLQVWAAKLLGVLGAMHQRGFVHADLKPENILIEAGTGQLIVIDYGFAVPLPHEHRGRGNFAIKAPETAELIEARLHEGLDLWAYGSTLASWHAFHYLSAWKGKRGVVRARLRRGVRTTPYAMVTIGNGKRYKFGAVPREFPAPLRAVLYLMTVPNPNLRTFHTDGTKQFLRGLRFFAGIDWMSLDREQQQTVPLQV